MQIVVSNPLVLVDVAHNEQAAKILKSELVKFSHEENARTEKFHAIVGMLKDKEVAGVVKIMADIISNWSVIELSTPRAMPAVELKQILIEQTRHIADEIGCYNNFSQAYKMFLNQSVMAGDIKPRLIVFGSFFTVSDALEYINSTPN